ncbi:hypothetical protein BJX68DRAFT_263385 [Aspergillus pseudodeflectus]|uniref:Uncharacterized protein n=1 Tax=Aspergillus pseudodeflectus TaxID=176178 RepID=A0ABR4KX57_9EURO
MALFCCISPSPIKEVEGGMLDPQPLTRGLVVVVVIVLILVLLIATLAFTDFVILLGVRFRLFLFLDYFDCLTTDSASIRPTSRRPRHIVLAILKLFAKTEK